MAGNSGGVQSVERAFELLELIGRAGGECSLSHLSSESPLPPPTIHRLLRTLVGIGYVRQLPNRSYALGPRLIRLGEVANRQLGAVAAPVLGSLVAELSETASLAVLDGDMVIYVAQVPSPHSMRTNNEVGRRVTMHNTAVGKAVLAELDDARILKHVTQAGLTPATEWSVTSLSGVFAAVERVRAEGVATDEQEYEVGVCGMAVAVPGAPTPMAVGISGPVARFDEGLRARAVGALRAAADTISEALIGAKES
ncbi:IclR family transcriptional regulator [Gordonia rubripertincta]|uniref:Glycerol operon regulatory protein n=2 Tax=Gordonia rubripertincta TaxID=36822 RepID=A0AAW4G8D9_GORRU|nr:IclR family transcriptional regulator [Gordonia rubripertincta]MBM7279544.1 IclR family transcriptional regulator [Gordonia rubripertincta]MDG6782353.1 IclR family transcriptional regulator [Gordonia rubripertincta]NKY64450.1 IclR family transcriptional regulator [Gordonia rubripertincta]QMU22947.1 IclR family transcriptional regulator [Gordonia rubripertincta]TSD96186.1 IclR family transcriptional regulator [Gordonia rubripertincta]